MSHIFQDAVEDVTKYQAKGDTRYALRMGAAILAFTAARAISLLVRKYVA